MSSIEKSILLHLLANDDDDESSDEAIALGLEDKSLDDASIIAGAMTLSTLSAATSLIR